jgi:D-inositol-3-phosphate glycosyltransferase
MSEMRRVAFLSEHASPLALLGGVDSGGQNVYVDEVSRNLGALGYHVDVFTRWDNPDAPEIVAWGPNVRVINLQVGQPQWVFKDDLWPLMPAFADAILRFMVQDGIRYDILHGNFWMSGWVATQLAGTLKVPAVQIFHATGKTKRLHQGGDDTSPDERIEIESEVVRAVDRLIAQCPVEQQELVDEYGADPSHVVVIPSAVNIETFRPVDRSEARSALGLPANLPLVGYIGRMLPRKDVRNIVRAMALLSDIGAGLLIVGGESEEPDAAHTPEIGVLQRLAEGLGISERVIFVGKRQPDVLRQYYSAADVIATTPWYEPFGLTPLEAMACGRPVVGSAVGGITFTVEDGVTGYLVPPRNPEVLAARLRELLEDDSTREQMGRAARTRVEREFTWPQVARRTAALYEELLTAPREFTTVGSHHLRTPQPIVSLSGEPFGADQT